MALIIDGGFSSQVTKHVGELEKNPLWCAKYLWSDPQAVINTHYDYAAAGADIITTDTYQAYIDGFQTHLGLTREESTELIKKAVNYAREAISKLPEGRRVMIAGSVGPYGASLQDGSEYKGNYMDYMTKEKLIDWHRPRMKALVEAGVDFLAMETVPGLEEGEALVTLLKEFPNQKAWLSFSCKDGNHISHGEEFSKTVVHCWKQNPDQLVAVGTNCVHPMYITSLLKSVRAENQDIPLIVYPNSGETWQAGVGWVGKESCVPLITYLPEWLSLGVRYIGGCCQTTADDIRKYRNFLDNNTVISTVTH